MQGDLVLRKQVELSALQSRDPKTRRLFILANGKRSLEELYQLCGYDEAQGDSIVEYLLVEGCVGVVNGTTQPPMHGFAITEEIVETIIGKLANHLGPIATILVHKNMCSGQVVTTEELHQILATLADNIEEHKDKQQFMANARGAF